MSVSIIMFCVPCNLTCKLAVWFSAKHQPSWATFTFHRKREQYCFIGSLKRKPASCRNTVSVSSVPWLFGSLMTLTLQCRNLLVFSLSWKLRLFGEACFSVLFFILTVSRVREVGQARAASWEGILFVKTDFREKEHWICRPCCWACSSLTQDFAQFGVRLVLLVTWKFSRPNFSVLSDAEGLLNTTARLQLQF